jgi:putative membrane protein
MTIRWFVAAMHLLALGIGLGAIWARSRALRGPLDAPGLSRLFYADNCWGVAALLWLATGLFRAFGGLEKGTEYYINNWLFLTKMGLFLLVLALEIWPMVTFIRWRIRLGRGEPPDTSPAPTFAWMSAAQAILIVLIVIAATGVARGVGI